MVRCPIGPSYPSYLILPILSYLIHFIYPIHPILSYPSYPIHVILSILSYPFIYPIHPILSYPSYPIHFILSILSYPSYPIHPILSTLSYPLYPIHHILSTLSILSYPIHPILSYPSYPIHLILSILSYPSYPIHPILSILSYPSYPFHPILFTLSYPLYPIHHILSTLSILSYPSYLAKILEKLVLSQVSSYLNSHNLYNTCQSAYRPGHSTETALLKVVNDLFLSLNKDNISVLALLDFSSAFDTIDHTILVHRLHTDFGFTDTVLQWFSSYLTDRTHYVSLCNHCSDFAPVHSGVPQGSVLGPILFTMYIKPLSAIIDSHSIIHHSFADDLQLQMSAPPDRISELLHSMQSCISDVKAWATVNMLRLNDSKTELMLVTSKRSKHLHNLPTSITIGNAQIPFKQSVKNLGFTLDYIGLDKMSSYYECTCLQYCSDMLL